MRQLQDPTLSRQGNTSNCAPGLSGCYPGTLCTSQIAAHCCGGNPAPAVCGNSFAIFSNTCIAGRSPLGWVYGMQLVCWACDSGHALRPHVRAQLRLKRTSMTSGSSWYFMMAIGLFWLSMMACAKAPRGLPYCIFSSIYMQVHGLQLVKLQQSGCQGMSRTQLSCQRAHPYSNVSRPIL